MAIMNNIDIEHDDILKEEMDLADDRMCEDMFCMQCGANNPRLLPMWTGKENWYEGYCICNPNKIQEFVYSPVHNGDDI